MANVGDYKLSFSIDLNPFKQGLEGMLSMSQSAAHQLELILNLKVQSPDMSGIEAAFQKSTQETEQYLEKQKQAEVQEQKTGTAGQEEGEKISAGMKKAESSASQLFFRLGALKMGIDAIKSTVGEWLQLENVHLAAEAQLAQAMKNRGIYTEAAMKDADDFANEQQKLTGIGNDQILQAMSMLTIAGAQGEELKKMSIITENFGRIMAANTGGQVDMASAARAVAEVMAGNVGILSRYGIMLSEEAKKTHDMTLITNELIAKTNEQAEAYGKTLPGQEAIAGAALEDLKKKWASILNGEIAGTIPMLTSVFEELQKLPPSLQAVTMGVTALGGAFLVLGGIASPWLFAIGGAVTALLAAKRAVNELIPPLDDQIDRIKADDSAVRKLTGSLDGMTAAQKRATVAKLRDQLVDLNKKFDENGMKADFWGSVWKGVIAKFVGNDVPQVQVKLTEAGKQTLQQIKNIKEAIKETEDSLKPKTGAPATDTGAAEKEDEARWKYRADRHNEIEKQRIADYNAEQKKAVDQEIEREKWKTEQINQIRNQRAEETKKYLEKEAQLREQALQNEIRTAEEWAHASMGGVEALFGEYNRKITDAFGSQKTLLDKFMAGTLMSFATFLERKLEKWIVEQAAEALTAKTTEAEKTAATQGGVLARLASIGAEVAGDIAAAGASIVGAVANAVRWVFTTIPFPFSLAVAGGAVGLIYELWEGAKKMFGFAKGGMVSEPTAALIGEGDEPEVIAPKSDFVGAFRDVLRPEILREVIAPQIKSEYLRGPGSMTMSSADSHSVVSAVNGLVPHLRKITDKLAEGMTIDNKELVKSVEYYQAQQRDRTRV